MNAVPVTHACLGNHEFDHSIETLGQRIAELECEVVNTNVFACPLGAEREDKARAAEAALENADDGLGGVPHPESSVAQPFDQTDDASAGAFLDHLPRTTTVELGGVKIGLMGLCTTSTPLSSARKPRGVVFADAIPLAKAAASRLVPECDAVVALTHQTLPEDARLAEEVPEIALILGGHEHTPFAGRMGHGANAHAAGTRTGASGSTSRAADDAEDECVHARAGTLCVKAGMDAENVIVATIELGPDAGPRGSDRGGECDAAAIAARLATRRGAPTAEALAAAADAHRGDFGRGGLWATGPRDEEAQKTPGGVVDEAEELSGGARSNRADADATAEAEEAEFEEFEEAFEEECSVTAANNVVPLTERSGAPSRRGDEEKSSEKSSAESEDEEKSSAEEDSEGSELETEEREERAIPSGSSAMAPSPSVVSSAIPDPVPVAPGAEIGSAVVTTRPGSRVVVTARMFSLRGYRTDPAVDADIWARSEVLRGLNRHTLSLHEHGARLGLAPLSSRDSRTGQCTLGTLFATILRDECRADVCLYNSGGIRGNAWYGSDALTYGDLVAEVPFENNIISLELTGAEVQEAVAFSEAEQIRKSREGGSWGGYLQWDEGVEMAKNKTRGDAHGDVGFDWRCVRLKGQRFDPERTYRVVTWAGLLDGADDIPTLRDVGRKMAKAQRSRGSGSGSGSEPDGASEEEDDAPVICGSDGIPFKILVVKHLARRRWGELLSSGRRFEDLDGDGDGRLGVADVRDALARHTASRSVEQEAEAMVRGFDGDGDGALTREDVAELVRHFEGPDERRLWARADERRARARDEERRVADAGRDRNASRDAGPGVVVTRAVGRIGGSAPPKGPKGKGASAGKKREVQARAREEEDA